MTKKKTKGILLLLILIYSLTGCEWTWEDECEQKCGSEYNECSIDPDTGDVIACRYVRE